jgi:hypothetical protein
MDKGKEWEDVMFMVRVYKKFGQICPLQHALEDYSKVSGNDVMLNDVRFNHATFYKDGKHMMCDIPSSAIEKAVFKGEGIAILPVSVGSDFRAIGKSERDVFAQEGEGYCRGYLRSLVDA